MTISRQALFGKLGGGLYRSIESATAFCKLRGYADSIAAKAMDLGSNQALSESRALQVAQILLAAGVPVQRINVSGKGVADPVGENGTAQGRAQNRRVEIVVTQ